MLFALLELVLLALAEPCNLDRGLGEKGVRTACAHTVQPTASIAAIIW
jgi:hypothetical protein